jgi:hypothetical protein
VPNGGLLDTATPGLKSFTVTAKDTAGNTSSTTIWYRVAYVFKGWGGVQPPMTYNKATAGVPKPIRFSMEDWNHTAISDLSSVQYVFTAKFPCSARDPMGERQSPDEYQAMGNLTYNPGTKEFTYAWTTKTTWAGQCRVLVFVLKDASIRPLLFDFR